MASSAPPRTGNRRRGVTLIELLCSMAIIGILVALLLGPVSRAVDRARALRWDMELGTHIGEITDKTRRLAGGGNGYRFSSRRQWVEVLALSGPARRFVESDRVWFQPFGSGDPPEKPVLVVTNWRRTGISGWVTVGHLTAPVE